MPLNTGNDVVRSGHFGVNFLFGKIVLGSSGAIASSDTPGFTMTKEAGAGLYTGVLDTATHELLQVIPTLNQQSTPAAVIIHEDADLTSGTTFAIQVTNSTSGAAADAASGDTIKLAVILRTSGVTP